MFLKLRLSASNREMVVWLKSLPYSLPIATPTSPWQRQISSVRNGPPLADTQPCPSSFWNYYLGESQFDTTLFKGAGKLLQLLQVTGLFTHVAPVTCRSQSRCQRGSHGAAGGWGCSDRRHNTDAAAAARDHGAAANATAAASTGHNIAALLPLRWNVKKTRNRGQ